jgi:CheY-like chemotaxis protein
LKRIIDADKRAMEEERNAMIAAASYPAPDAERNSKLPVAGLTSRLGLARAVFEARSMRATAERLPLSRPKGLRCQVNQLSRRQTKSGIAANPLAPEWKLRRIMAPVNGRIGEAVPDAAPFGEQRLDSAIVLVAANVDLAEKLSGVLADSDLALLHAQSKQEATGLLERLKSPFDLAIVDLGLPDVEGWDLIMRLTRPRRAVRIIAATVVYSKPFAKQMGELGVDAVVPRAITPKEWRTRVEAALAA